MLNYIKSEFYRIFNHKYTYGYLGFFAICGVLFELILKLSWSGDPATLPAERGIFYGIMMASVVGWYLVIMVIDGIWSAEGRIRVLKNTISFGISRAQVYIGKLIVGVIMVAFSVAFIWLVYLLSTLILCGASSLTFVVIDKMMKTFILLAPLWLGAIGLSYFLSSVISNSTVHTVLYVLYFTFLPNLIQLVGLKFPKAYEFLINKHLAIYPDQIMSASVFSPELIKNVMVIGLSYFVILSVIGLMFFRKKEIN